MPRIDNGKLWLIPFASSSQPRQQPKTLPIPAHTAVA